MHGGGLGVEGSSPMTPRGEAPKNPAGTNALGPVGIPPKAKATALPLQNPAAAGLFVFVCFVLGFAADARFFDDGPPTHKHNNDTRNTGNAVCRAPPKGRLEYKISPKQ